MEEGAPTNAEIIEAGGIPAVTSPEEAIAGLPAITTGQGLFLIAQELHRLTDVVVHNTMRMDAEEESTSEDEEPSEDPIAANMRKRNPFVLDESVEA